MRASRPDLDEKQDAQGAHAEGFDGQEVVRIILAKHATNDSCPRFEEDVHVCRAGDVVWCEVILIGQPWLSMPLVFFELLTAYQSDLAEHAEFYRFGMVNLPFGLVILRIQPKAATAFAAFSGL
jgi:hypothetical protein